MPDDFQSVLPSNIGSNEPEPVFSHVGIDWYKSRISTASSKAKAMDTAWLIARLQNTHNQQVPGWSGFNQVVSKVNPTKIIVGLMSVINEPAHNFDTIWTAIQNYQKMTSALKQKFTILTFDEQLYCKAKMLQWYRSDECQNLVVMLGGFQIQMNFSKVIGQHMEDSGLKDILVESDVYGENTA